MKLKWMFITFFFIFFLTRTVQAVAPNITDVHANPLVVPINWKTYLIANVTDEDNDLDKVFVNVTTPNNESGWYQMFNVSPTIFKYQYQPSEYGIYTFYVWANDTTGNSSQSNSSWFLVPKVANITKNITINVMVAPSCDGVIAYFPFPDKVLQNQTVVFIIIFENTGNIPLTDRNFSMVITNITGHVIASYSGPGFITGTIDVREIDFYWNVWEATVPVGNYTATAAVIYRSTFFRSNETIDDFDSLNSTATCEPINQTTNTTTCYQIWNTSCRFVPTGDPIDVNTTQTSDLTVSKMYPGTTGYEGILIYNNTTYYSINFMKDNCEEYCYSCITPDRNISEEDECNYEGYTIPFIRLYVYDVQGDGKKVSYKETEFYCNYLEKIYDCVVYPDNTAFCNVTYNCYGRTEVVKPFEVVNITGVVEQPTTIPTTTPTPKPTPTPTPTPTAGVGVQPGETQIAIEIEPINHTVRGEQGQWIPNVINVTNIGNANVTDIVLIPIVPEGWEVKTALISFLGVGETLNRTVFVKPPYTALGTYAIPIKAVKGNVTLDIDYYWVEVLEALNRTVLQLIEVPKVIYMRTSSNLTVAILARNAGKIPLHNISVRLENIENCLDWFGFEGIEELGANETGQISLYLRSKGVPAACNSTLIAWSKEGAYAFADIYIVVTQPLFILPIPRIPFLLLLLLLVEFVLLKMKKKNEENILINAAFYIVFVAIVLLLTYVILWYLGLIKSLP